jgi:acyl-CoA thioester hydrolase
MSLGDLTNGPVAGGRGRRGGEGVLDPSVGGVVRADGAEFEAAYRVQTGDLDELNHANNVSYVRWLEWITRKHNAAFGLGQDYLRANGTVFVVVDYQLRYLRACAPGEDLRIRTRVVEYGHYSHDRAYRIVAASDGALVFEGAGKWVSMNLASGRLMRTPREYQRRMAAMAAVSPPVSDQGRCG